MATNDFVRFCSEYLPQHPGLAKQLEALTDRRSRAQAMAAAAHEAGFAFSAAEAEEGLKEAESRIRAADAELTEDELASVTGGSLSALEATQSVAAKSFLALQEATQMESRKFQT